MSSALSDDKATLDFRRDHDRYRLYVCGTDARQTSNFKRISPFPATRTDGSAQATIVPPTSPHYQSLICQSKMTDSPQHHYIAMKIARRILVFTQSALKSYGPSGLKRVFWEKEYSGDKWNFADHTEGDCVYSHLEKHAANGDILDLGCGSGNTANELAANAYQNYLGVDISETCLNKARKRSEENGRAAKNKFTSGDFLKYSPTEKFNVILFRESMYHVPMGQIKSMLDRYSEWLKDGGVFVVRLA